MKELKELKEYLEEIAKRETAIDNEDFNPMEASGGNFDDAYSMGLDDGETELAQHILLKYFNKENDR